MKKIKKNEKMSHKISATNFQIIPSFFDKIQLVENYDKKRLRTM